LFGLVIGAKLVGIFQNNGWDFFYSFPCFVSSIGAFFLILAGASVEICGVTRN
jgi:hypothetical protein